MNPFARYPWWLLATIIGITFLNGCGPILVGGTAVGISVIHDRRTTATVLEDQKIELFATARLDEDKELSKHARVGFTSYNRVVLLTGQADTPEVKRRIIDLVQGFPEIERVVDEITVGPPASVEEIGDDLYVTSKAKLALFNVELPSFDPTRVKVVTERGVVYLMGLVTKQEAAAVVEKIRYIRGVQRVVKIFEYIKLDD